jgi:hypothetical protein
MLRQNPSPREASEGELFYFRSWRFSPPMHGPGPKAFVVRVSHRPRSSINFFVESDTHLIGPLNDEKSNREGFRLRTQNLKCCARCSAAWLQMARVPPLDLARNVAAVLGTSKLLSSSTRRRACLTNSDAKPWSESGFRSTLGKGHGARRNRGPAVPRSARDRRCDAGAQPRHGVSHGTGRRRSCRRTASRLSISSSNSVSQYTCRRCGTIGFVITAASRCCGRSFQDAASPVLSCNGTACASARA